MQIPALSDLLDLQAVDLEIDRLLEQRQGLPELERYRARHAARVEAEERHAELAARLREVDLELDKGEGELEMVEGRLQEAETRLFAGGMSGRETEHKRLEVQSLRGQKEAMEERVLAVLERREELQEEVTAAAEELGRLTSEEQALEGVIAAAWKAIDARIARKEAEKAEMVPAIPQDLLDLYEQLRRTKEGVAVGRLEDGQCGGCHLHLSPTEQLEAVESSPPRCVHCRRLLVV